MISFATTPAFLLLAGTFCYAVMGAVLLRYREAPGATVTAYALAACLIWVAGGLATSLVGDLRLQLLALNVSYVGACATPVAILVFVSFYTSAKPIEWKVTRWLLVLPAVSVLLVWTNPFHEAMWAHPPLDTAGGFSLRAQWGPWFKFVHLPYMWTLALVGAAYLLRAMMGQNGLSRANGSRITRGQASVLFGVLVTTLAVNVIAVVGPVPPGGVSTSPTAVAIALSSFCFLWLFAQVELVPLRHVAHKRILHTMPDPVFVLDEHDRVLDLNPRASDLVEDPAPAGRFAQALFADESPLLALLRQDGDVLSEVRLQTGLSYEVRLSPFHDATGARRGRTLMLRDVTERNLHNRRMHSIVDVSPNGIVRLLADINEDGVVTDAICIFANASAAAYLGVEHSTMAGSRMLPAMPAVGPQMLGVFQQALNEGQDQQVDVPVAGENEDPLWFRVIVSPVDDELMITFMEVTEEKQREAAMQEVAFSDPLTRALNRRGLQRAFRDLPPQGRRGHGSHAVLFLDLDNFKAVNDTHGHAVGDRLLKEFVARMSSAIREDDLLARVGGDEFVIVLVDSDPDTTSSTVERLIQVSKAPYWLADQAVTCVPSIGIAHITNPEKPFYEALVEADEAMYKAKTAGRASQRVGQRNLARKP